MAKFTMIIGIPGSGKSTVAKKMTDQNTVYLSSDELRLKMFDDENEQGRNSELFGYMLSETKKALVNGKDVIYDATNINAKRRTGLLKQLPKGAYKRAVMVMAPFHICVERNGSRDRKVPEDKIKMFYETFTPAWYGEGWDEIEVIRNYDTVLYPEDSSLTLILESAKGVDHDNPHHHRFIYEHMRAMYEAALANNEDDLVCLACLYHDIGKPSTKVFTNAKGEPSEIAHFYRHENVGAYMALCDPNCPLELAVLIAYHMRFFNKNGNFSKLEAIIGPNLHEKLKAVYAYDVAYD